MGEGNELEPLVPLALIGLVLSSSLISSAGSLLGAGVMLWADPPEDTVTVVLCGRLLIGHEVPLTFGLALVFGSSDLFLKNPAMEVWFLELEFDFVSEGVGVPRVLDVDFEEGAICREAASAIEGSVGHVTKSMLIERYPKFGIHRPSELCSKK